MLLFVLFVFSYLGIASRWQCYLDYSAERRKEKRESYHALRGPPLRGRVGRGSDTVSEDSDLSLSDDDSTWISWFCSLKGNEFFVEVDEKWIEDDFNLSQLSSHVPYYDYALDLILDVESPNDEILTEEQHEMIESAAEMLYGLIHQRYILTNKGLQAMLEKFTNIDFGRCPRVCCNGQPVLPVGQSDQARTSTVKVYCPRCKDIYFPWSKYQGNIDGAYFGTTFPHLFMMTFNHLQPSKPQQEYVPKIFGFKVNEAAYHQPKGASLLNGRMRRYMKASGAQGEKKKR